MYSSSSWSSCLLAQTGLALCVKVLKTLYFAEILWQLSQWRSCTPWWEGRCTTSPRPSRRQCASGSMIHSLMGTLAGSNCPTFGIRSCMTPLSFISSHTFAAAPYNGHTPSKPKVGRGHTAYFTSTSLVNIALHHGVPSPFGTMSLPLIRHWCHLWYI